MKKLMKLLFVVITGLAVNSMVYADSQLLPCPSVASIKNVVFSGAIFNKAENYWQVHSNNDAINGRWTVNFYPIKAATKGAAIRKGMKELQTGDIYKPQQPQAGICIYAVSLNSVSPVVKHVEAVTAK